jgi:hypothetical protein
MDPENKENSNEFGKVIDALHSKQKLPSLRTYQGDMAEFIKNKNESVISIAVKTKERKEEKEKEEEKEEETKETKKEKLEILPRPTPKEGFQINLTIIVSSLLLIFGGVAAFFYIFNFLGKEPVAPSVVEEKIIPYNNLVTLANVSGQNLGAELGRLSPANGINVIKISDTGGLSIQKAKDFFNFLGVSLPATLERTLKNDYAAGVFSQNGQNSLFLIITVDDFGRAFSGMLEWEGNMDKDLSFLNPATSTEIFAWKDIIIKNKDTRGLVNDKKIARIAYTFLDKNTILIVNNLSVIGDISSAYASRSVAR